MIDKLASLYLPYLQLQQAKFLRIDHDDAMVAIVYKVIEQPYRESILKICTRAGDYLREIILIVSNLEEKFEPWLNHDKFRGMHPVDGFVCSCAIPR